MNMNKYLAELLGTFGLTLVVLLSLNGAFPVATAVLAALTLGLFVYTIGHISGTHINPAVTLGLLSIKKIGLQETLGYIVAQFIGAGLAMVVASQFIVNPVVLTAANTGTVGIFEFIGMFFFAFGIAAVVFGKTPASLSGFVVGGSLLLGLSLASFKSNGVLNPAVAFGIGSFSLMYIIGPIIGSIVAMQVFKLLNGEK
ncbi:aquaporin [Candidatus Azambacteria bacterium]|nr:aquaporin [Candidatus Azambacteria bacterium]